jgi:hypothetical protein
MYHFLHQTLDQAPAFESVPLVSPRGSFLSGSKFLKCVIHYKNTAAMRVATRPIDVAL